MACSHCGGDGHNRVTCPIRVAEEEQKVREHERRLGTLEGKVGALSQDVKHLGLVARCLEFGTGILAALGTLFVRQTEWAPLLSSVNVALLVLVSFVCGFLAGWVVTRAAKVLLGYGQADV